MDCQDLDLMSSQTSAMICFSSSTVYSLNGPVYLNSLQKLIVNLFTEGILELIFNSDTDGTCFNLVSDVWIPQCVSSFSTKLHSQSECVKC